MLLPCAMLTIVKRSVVLSGLALAAFATSPAVAQLPALPGPYASPPAAQTPQNAPPAPLTPQQLYEHVRRGVVAIEKNGFPVAIGTVLGGDGRILTALSGLGGAEGADVRYANGTAVHAKVGHSDKAADLALLVPQSGKWSEGLSASEADPSGAELRAMLPGARGVHLGPAPAEVKGRADAHARDGEALLHVLDVDVKGPLVAGAPLLDSTGGVIAVLVRACKGAPAPAQESSAWGGWPGAQAPARAAQACAPVIVGAPVQTIRSFLSSTPATAVAPAPWLGIRGDTVENGFQRGVRVLAVAPSSPAEKGGLKPGGDVIVAVDGQPVDTPERLADAIAKHAPGDSVKLLVLGDGKFREVAVALRPAP